MKPEALSSLSPQAKPKSCCPGLLGGRDLTCVVAWDEVLFAAPCRPLTSLVSQLEKGQRPVLPSLVQSEKPDFRESPYIMMSLRKGGPR